MNFALINQAWAATPNASSAQSGVISTIMLLVGFFLIFYFLLIRPQTKRANEHKKLVDHLEKGDEVMTNGGLVGKITKISDDFLLLNIAENVDVKLQKSAVSSVLPKGTIKSLN